MNPILLWCIAICLGVIIGGFSVLLYQEHFGKARGLHRMDNRGLDDSY